MSYSDQAFKKAEAKAIKLGFIVKRSTRKNKKLDVFKKESDGELVKLASIGDLTYEDFNEHGDEARRERYKKRFEYCRHKINTPCYFSDNILW